MAHVPVDELTAGCASLAVRAKQAQTKRDTLAIHFRGLEVAVATRDGELGVLVWAVQSQEELIAAVKTWASAAGVLARNKFDKMFEFCLFVEGLNSIVGRECMQIGALM